MAEDNSTVSPLSSGGTSSILNETALDLKLPEQHLPTIDLGSGRDHITEDPQTQLDSRTRNAQDINKYMSSALSESKDPFKYQKVYSYNPEADGNRINQNFQRYYQHSSFDKLGFTPFRDNEDLYNDRGSKSGDLWRAAKAGAKLMYTGFASPIRSFSDIFTGNPMALDYKSAQEMAQQNAVGSSSRGGVTGFTSNLITNGGYTLGIVAETVGEGLLVSALTEGAGVIPEASRVAATLKNLTKLNTYKQAVGSTLSTLKNFDTAKTVYNALKGGINLINPLEHTFEAVKTIRNTENLSNLVKASTTVGGFYRDLRMANLVASESKLEGASVSADFKQARLDEYYSEHGFAATGAAYDKIIQMSQAAGETAMYANLPTIFLTDKITFDGLLKPFKSLDGIYTKAGKALNFTKKEGFELVSGGTAGVVKGLLKPKTYGKAVLNYFKGNFAEGIQESVQEVISGAAKDYYTDLYNNKSKQGLDYVQSNIGKQFNGQGFETFASGFFMGGLFGIGGKIGQVANVGRLKIQDKLNGTNKFEDYKAQKEKYAQEDVNRLNELYKDPLKYFGAGILKASNTTLSHEGKTDSERKGDQRTWQDLDNQEVWGHITTALDTNTYDLFMDHLEDISKMDKQSIQEAYGVDGEEALSKINKIKERAENIKEAYEDWNDKAPNPYNPISFKKDTPEYTTEAIAYSAWNNARNHAIFYNYSYNRNTERIKSIVESVNKNSPLNDVTLLDLQPLFDNAALSRELTSLQQEISTLKQISGSKRELNQKIKKQKLLKEYRDKVKNHFLSQVVGSSKEIQQESDTSDTTEDLKRSYENYLKELAKQKKLVYSQPLANDTFEKVKDIHKLGIDNVNLIGAVNHLADPKGFYDYYDRLNKTLTDLYNSRGEYIQKSVKQVQERVELNTVLQGLYDRGIVIGADDLDKLSNEGEIPKEFYDVAAKQVVNKNNPKYLELSDVIKAFLTANDKLKEEVKPEDIGVEITVPTQTSEGIIHIIRHGKTIEDEKGINSGPTQEPITAEGAREVREGAEGKVDTNLTKIITSGRERAKESAQVISDGKNITLEENIALDPWNTGDNKTGFAEIKDEDWKKLSDWFAVHPDAREYSGDDEDLKSRFSDRSLLETFNEFKQRVLSALPGITNELSDGGAIMTHSNVIQLIKSFIVNGSRNDDNIGILYIQNEPSKNGEFIEFQRQQINPNFIAKKVSEKVTLPETHAKIPQAEALDLVEGRLIKATTGEAIDELYDEVEAEIAEGDYVSDGIEELFDKRREQLAKNFDIKNIKKGEILLMNDKRYGLMKVVLIGRGQIKLRKVGEETGALLVVPEKNIQNQVKYRYSSGMKEVTSKSANADEKKLAKTNQDNNSDFMKDVAVKTKLQEEVKTEGTQKVNDDFFNDLGCK